MSMNLDRQIEFLTAAVSRATAGRRQLDAMLAELRDLDARVQTVEIAYAMHEKWTLQAAELH